MLDVTTALVAASAAHAGFSVVVSVVVYPALRDASDSPVWSSAHEAHSRRIARVVGPLYLVVAVVCGWALLASPGSATLIAIGGNAVAVLVTAALAAPLHGRLGREGPQPRLLARLLLADRGRTAAALVAVGASLLA